MATPPSRIHPNPPTPSASSAGSSTFISAAQAGPSTPTRHVPIKDCPHRGDLLGFGPQSPPESPPLQSGLIRVGSISTMLMREMLDAPPRQIAPLPMRRMEGVQPPLTFRPLRSEDDRIDFSPHRRRRPRTDEPDTLRPRPREFGEEDRMGRWNRDMQEAISRRVGDAPSPGAAARRHEEITRWGDLNSHRLERFMGVLDSLDGMDEYYADINWDQAEQMFDPTRGSNVITPEMSRDEQTRVLRVIAQGVSRWSGRSKKSAAAETLERLPWKDVVGTEEMARDTYCSVCHDEYEDNADIAVTPCKHMYHHGCLETWLETPNTSSCPMCRRDLAVLVGITKKVPGKTRQEALPLWMGM